MSHTVTTCDRPIAACKFCSAAFNLQPWRPMTFDSLPEALQAHAGHAIVADTTTHDTYSTQVVDGMVYIVKNVYTNTAETTFRCDTCHETIELDALDYEWSL